MPPAFTHGSIKQLIRCICPLAQVFPNHEPSEAHCMHAAEQHASPARACACRHSDAITAHAHHNQIAKQKKVKSQVALLHAATVLSIIHPAERAMGCCCRTAGHVTAATCTMAVALMAQARPRVVSGSCPGAPAALQGMHRTSSNEAGQEQRRVKPPANSQQGFGSLQHTAGAQLRPPLSRPHRHNGASNAVSQVRHIHRLEPCDCVVGMTARYPKSLKYKYPLSSMAQPQAHQPHIPARTRHHQCAAHAAWHGATGPLPLTVRSTDPHHRCTDTPTTTPAAHSCQ
jgi:hypothetical protein